MGDLQAWQREAFSRLQQGMDALDRDEEADFPDIFLSPAIRQMCLALDEELESQGSG